MISEKTLTEFVNKIKVLGRENIKQQLELSDDSIDRYLRLAKEKGIARGDEGQSRPKVLVLDIETTPIIGTFWRTGKQHIIPDHILQDVGLLSYAVKWLYEPDVFADILTVEEVMTADTERLVRDVWEFVDYADMIVAHNGQRFDMRMLNTFFILHRLPPPSPYQMIDTLKMFYREAAFSSNKQGYLNKILGLTQKMEHEGLSLWHKCMFGEQEALDTMLAYNKQDIMGLEELYTVIRPYAKSHPNMGLYYHSGDNVTRCHRCGSADLEWLDNKPYVTPLNRYTSYRCRNCDGIGRSRTSELTAQRKGFLTSSVAR